MTIQIINHYKTTEITGGIASDLLRAVEHEDFDSYILNGGLLAEVSSFYAVRGIMQEVMG